MVRFIAVVEKQQHSEKLHACEGALLLVCISVCRLAPEVSFSANTDVNNIEMSVDSGISNSVYICVCVCLNINIY